MPSKKPAKPKEPPTKATVDPLIERGERAQRKARQTIQQTHDIEEAERQGKLMTKPPSKPGPAPELFKIEEDLTFAQAVKRATLKKKPATGWPKMARGE